MFMLPPGSDGKVEGTTDENPIILPGQNKAEFDCFLSFYYPKLVMFSTDCEFNLTIPTIAIY